MSNGRVLCHAFGPLAVLAVAAFALAGGCHRNVGPTEEVSSDIPSSPEDIKSYVQMLEPKGRVFSGMGQDVRAVAANFLAEIGPEAKKYGAVPPLQRLSRDKDPKVAAAAKAALAKIEGQ